MSNFRVKRHYASFYRGNCEPYNRGEGGTRPGGNSGSQSRDEEVLCFRDSGPSVLPAYILLLQTHKCTSTSGTIERHKNSSAFHYHKIR